MDWRRRIEIPLYRVLKPLSQDPSERRKLPGEVPGSLLERRPRGAMTILRGKAATIIVTAALAGGGGVLIGGFVENQAHEAELASMDAAEEEQIRDEMEWSANHDVCMAKAQARDAPDEGVFDVLGDPQLDKCYAEQRLQVAEIEAGT